MVHAILYFTTLTSIFCALEFFGIFYDRRKLFEKSKYTTLPVLFACSSVIFAFNLLEIIIVNIIITMIMVEVAAIIVFKIKLPSFIPYSILFIVILDLSDILCAAIFQLEFNCILPRSIIAQTNYNKMLATPLPCFISFLMVYIPILIIRRRFSNNKLDVSPKFFWVFLILPILNLISFFLLPIMGLDISVKSYKIAFSIYEIISFISVCLLLFIFQKYAEESQKSRDLLQEKLNEQHEKDLLTISSKALKTRLSLVEDAMEKERILRHDRRHFESTIYSLLSKGDEQSITQARLLLEEKINTEPKRLRKWCDNDTVNATFEYYISLAEKSNIPVESSLSIPKEISVDSLKLSIAIGNLMENAIHANEKLKPEERFIHIKSLCKKQLLIQIENACSKETKLNKEGIPFTSIQGHGTGTRSVLAFASDTNSEVLYQVNDGVFSVRMII